MPYSVLIVDDEMLIREGLRRHLDWATLDMEVIGVADGAESALEIARRRAPDILITDICMRSKTGFDLIEDLLELGLSPQVILISSYNDFSYAQRAVRLNVVREYILKPVDTDALTALLHKLRGELDLRPAPAGPRRTAAPTSPCTPTAAFCRTCAAAAMTGTALCTVSSTGKPRKPWPSGPAWSRWSGRNPTTWPRPSGSAPIC